MRSAFKNFVRNQTSPSRQEDVQTATPKYVIAHFILGNAAAMTVDDWCDDINQASAYGIDAFALNIAFLDPNNDEILSKAFHAAERLGGGFKLYLNFDYQAWGVWSANSVISKINHYQTSPAYFRYLGKPFVSTFEGTGNIDDWPSIKAATNCYFVPDWSSLGPHGAGKYLGAIADGLASWNAWPDGPEPLGISEDEHYLQVLSGRPYMMPISPWFYTSLPNYGKNWLWHSDNLWHYRWEQAVQLSSRTQFIQIITWNDYGESHYIGPVRPAGRPPGSEWYVGDHDHQGWGELLPYYISAYKSCQLSNLTFSASSPDQREEKLVYWYRINPGLAGSDGGTTGNNPSYQKVYPAHTLAEDRVFVTVVLHSSAELRVRIGNQSWRSISLGSAGINHVSTPFHGETGQVSIEVIRDGQTLLSAVGREITTDCIAGKVNWNPIVGRA